MKKAKSPYSTLGVPCSMFDVRESSPNARHLTSNKKLIVSKIYLVRNKALMRRLLEGLAQITGQIHLDKKTLLKRGLASR